MAAPRDFKDPGALIERTRVMFDLARIAMETDSTRLISIYIHQNDAKPNIAGVDTGTHPLTHHGNQPEKLDQLRLIEEAQFKELASLLGGLADSDAGAGSLLDQTSVIYGTSLGNGNSHANNNLPVLIAGGGFRHAQHLALGGSHDYPASQPVCQCTAATGNRNRPICHERQALCEDWSWHEQPRNSNPSCFNSSSVCRDRTQRRRRKRWRTIFCQVSSLNAATSTPQPSRGRSLLPERKSPLHDRSPARPANMKFGGNDRRTLYMTARDRRLFGSDEAAWRHQQTTDRSKNQR